MDLTNIQFSHDPLGLSGFHNQIMETTQIEYQSTPVTHYTQARTMIKKKSNSIKLLLWGLVISLIIIGLIIWNVTSKKVLTTLHIADKERWDLDYIEAKSKENKAEYKEGVGWVIYE